MGACSSNLSEDDRKRLAQAQSVERKIRLDAAEDEGKVKLLLLGGGESGKSTIFKQMKIIYGREFTDTEKKSQIPTVFLNIIQAIRLLADRLVDFKLDGKLKDVAKEAFVNSMGTTMSAVNTSIPTLSHLHLKMSDTHLFLCSSCSFVLLGVNRPLT